MASVELNTSRDGIATITLRGDRANALGNAFCQSIHAAFAQAAGDATIRGVLLTGSGRSFSAGRDLREADELGPSRRPNGSFESAIRSAFTFPKPMVAAVNGHAIAGGLVLALAADICILAEGDYRLGLTELDIGLPFPRIAFEVLRSALPAASITRLAYGADLIVPQLAHELGIGQELVPAAHLEERALAWLRPLAERPLAPFALCKRWLREDALARIDAQSEAERRDVALAGASDETRERLAGYAKRLRG